jgi:hypothetical protein
MLPSSEWNGDIDIDRVWNAKERDSERFTVDDAKSIMLSNRSQIRVIEIGSNLYKVCSATILFDCAAQLIISACVMQGHWVQKKNVDRSTEWDFEVSEDVAPDRWRYNR